MAFKNTAKVKETDSTHSYYKAGDYGYDAPPKELLLWSRLFQCVISQAGTYLLTKEFHNSHPGIYKCEGGCNIPGWGSLVLGSDYCSPEHGGRDKKLKKEITKLAELITKVVLEWNPEDPIKTMLNSACEYVKCAYQELHDAVERTHDSVFGGDALSDFFDSSPFTPKSSSREYETFCLLDFDDKSKEEVAQKFSDRDLGINLRQSINKKIRTVDSQSYRSAMSCRPERDKDGKLRFWINTGRSSQIDGWKTEKDIEEFLDSDGVL